MPPVRDWLAWNEPNNPVFLTPQYRRSGGRWIVQSAKAYARICNAVYAGETLGRGTITPRTLVRMWMRSDGHRAVLLNSKSRRIGVGATPDSSGRWVVAANFMRF